MVPMIRIPLLFRRVLAFAALALHLGGGGLHALSHASHQEPLTLCEDAGQGHWHGAEAHEREAGHACVQCQRLAAGGPLLPAFALPGAAGPQPQRGSRSPLQIASSAFLPSAPHRGPPRA